MKFKLVDTYLFWWPVVARVPDPDKAGSFLEQSFEMQFEALPLDEVNATEKAARAAADAGDFAARETQVLNRVSKDWRGVVVDDDRPMPFSDEALTLAMRFPWFRSAVYRGYLDALAGERPRLGN